MKISRVRIGEVIDGIVTSSSDVGLNVILGGEPGLLPVDSMNPRARTALTAGKEVTLKVVGEREGKALLAVVSRGCVRARRRRIQAESMIDLHDIALLLVDGANVLRDIGDESAQISFLQKIEGALAQYSVRVRVFLDASFVNRAHRLAPKLSELLAQLVKEDRLVTVVSERCSTDRALLMTLADSSDRIVLSNDRYADYSTDFSREVLSRVKGFVVSRLPGKTEILLPWVSPIGLKIEV